ncbi:DUF1656 domain-containing protein [Labrys portucalensis]|uniref:DUF1656 domain-containing protein n=1 Tax=Labrys neptuniae TaxID=376174 RepID=A0ABV6Z8B7_9HYPH|nr:MULTISPECIES: DUF1656 domain-containing protein [Labrys]MDT3377731.1 DUF1656 domain-containing protein [Labrys neptuniae]MDZ5449162.1 DUF1656 domain-containing protein [Labrys sp. ZIDIC5]OCC01400.1 hypothetical protein BA190_28325 [Labrys sp. WJW]
MNADIDIFGVYVPSLMILALVAIIANLLLRSVLARAGVYRLVWHRSLFDLALFVIVLSGLFSIFQRFVS